MCSKNGINLETAECGTKDKVATALRSGSTTHKDNPSGLENDRQEGVPLRHPAAVEIRGRSGTSDAHVSLIPPFLSALTTSDCRIIPSRVRQCKGHNDNGDISLLSNLLYISKNILIPEASRRTLALGKSRRTYNGIPAHLCARACEFPEWVILESKRD